MRFGVVRYAAVPSQALVDERNASIRAMPQAHWRLEPDRAAHPTGLVRFKILMEGATGPVTGRVHYRSGETEAFRELAWFASDQCGRAQSIRHAPPDIRELCLTVYSPDASRIQPTVTVQEVGELQKHLPAAYDFLRYHVRHPDVVISKLIQMYRLLRTGGISALGEKALRGNKYTAWIARYDTITEAERSIMRQHIARMSYKPRISILLPVYNVPETYLRRTIESVLGQVYTDWQLCIADDCSPDARVREVIQEYAARDPRITYIFKSTNDHISESTNSAAQYATGEFLAFLDHDDEIREHALYMVVRELQEHSDADLLFSDEDKISPDGVRHAPYFKSDWNSELLLSHNCICHLMVVRTELFKRLGGLRAECDGAQDWDLALRISEHTNHARIRHIPHVLYHWRMIDGSTAKDAAAKPYVTTAQIRAVAQHLERRGDYGARVEAIPEISMLRVRYPVPDPEPLVTVIVPSTDQLTNLARCIDGLLNTTAYKNLELIVANTGSNECDMVHYLQTLPQQDARVRVVKVKHPSSIPGIVNEAALQARGNLLGFIENDIQVISPDWLTEMVSRACRRNVAVVGARLLFPNGTVQHAGVITGIAGVAGNQFATHPMHSLGYFCRAVLPQNVSAVSSSCMLVHTHLFHQVGGFDHENLPGVWYDTDLCLKLRCAGYQIVFTPYAELLHHETVPQSELEFLRSKANFTREYKVMQDRWGATLTNDPFYNPNFALTNASYELGTPPKRFGTETRSR